MKPKNHNSVRKHKPNNAMKVDQYFIGFVREVFQRRFHSQHDIYLALDDIKLALELRDLALELERSEDNDD